jgi:imidazolonepropionase
MELHERVGSITAGKDANLIITKAIPGIDYLPYSFGHSWIDRVLIAGR